MTTHELTSTGRGHYGPTWPQRLIIEGGDAIAYMLHTVPRGEEQRAQTGGPQVPGPWASFIGLASVIDNHGGSARESAEEQQAAMVDDGRVTVGRIGDFDPGVTGARLARTSILAVQRIGQ